MIDLYLAYIILLIILKIDVLDKIIILFECNYFINDK